jgi:radical SAM protein with 4Fe4S-binding SPASM domain
MSEALTDQPYPPMPTPNPFHPGKLALHTERIEALARGEMVAPQTIEVDFTDGFCNQGCVHCCFGSNQRQPMVEVDPPALMRTLTEAYSLGTRAVEVVGGGEPTTHPKVREMIEGITQIGDGDMQVGIITNGVLAERLLSVADRLTYVRISLDSANPEVYAKMHGAPLGHFNKVLKNIERLREVIPNPPEDRKLGLGYLVVPPYNHREQQVHDGGRLADELGVDYLAYRPAELDESRPRGEWKEAQLAIAAVRQTLDAKGSRTAVFGGTGNRWETLEPGAHPTGRCEAKPVVAVIQANGDIAHCILYRNKREMKVGNIHTGSFAEQWFGDEHVKVWQEFQVDGCPNPCKLYGYNNIVRVVIAGEDVLPPPREEVAHHNFV